MERMRGGTLHDAVMKRGGCLREDEAADVIAQLASAISFLHARGVAHRDLKPENVLCAEADSVFSRFTCYPLPLIGFISYFATAYFCIYSFPIRFDFSTFISFVFTVLNLCTRIDTFRLPSYSLFIFMTEFWLLRECLLTFWNQFYSRNPFQIISLKIF